MAKIDKLSIPKVPIIFIIKHIAVPVHINSDCLENKPEFLIEFFNNIIILIMSRPYVYIVCILK